MIKKIKYARTFILVMLTHNVALPLLKRIRRPNVFEYNTNQLKQFAPGSLGNDLYLFLENRNLPLLKHYVRHDLKHVLLGYDTTDKGETSLQNFMLGNGRISFPVLATVIYGFITMPEYWRSMIRAFQKGRKSASIHHWVWNNLLHENTIELRNKVFQNK